VAEGVDFHRRLVLASASPRRRELLLRLGLTFVAVGTDIDESVLAGEDPVGYVRRLAEEKARSFDVEPGDIVIAADTTIDLDGVILGKPDDDADARRMLNALSGRRHLVHTGLAVRRGDDIVVDVETTAVSMVPISATMLDWYIATGDPLDKAGAYAIQESGAMLVLAVEGSVTNVIGLPLTLLDRVLDDLGVSLGRLLWESASATSVGDSKETPRIAGGGIESSGAQ